MEGLRYRNGQIDRGEVDWCDEVILAADSVGLRDSRSSLIGGHRKNFVSNAVSKLYAVAQETIRALGNIRGFPLRLCNAVIECVCRYT